MIKRFAKCVLRKLAGMPVIGRYIRMAAALYRLAEIESREQTNIVSVSQPLEEFAPSTDLENLEISLPVILRRLRCDIDHLEERLSLLAPKQDGQT